APAGELARGHQGDLADNAFGQSGAHFALGADERDKQRTAARVHLMCGIRPYPHGATFSPRFLRPTAYQERPAQAHQQLDTVVAVRYRLEARAPDDHHRGPGCHAVVQLERHERILPSHRNARKSASSFKTNVNELTTMKFIAASTRLE